MKNMQPKDKDLLIQKLVKKNTAEVEKDFPCVRLCLTLCLSCIIDS